MFLCQTVRWGPKIPLSSRSEADQRMINAIHKGNCVSLWSYDLCRNCLALLLLHKSNQRQKWHYLNKCGGVLIKLYVWILTFDIHIILMSYCSVPKHKKAVAVYLVVPDPDDGVRVTKAGEKRSACLESSLFLCTPLMKLCGPSHHCQHQGACPQGAGFSEWMASSWTHRGGRAGHVHSPGNECGHGGPRGAAHPSLAGSGSLTRLSTVNTAAGQATSPELHCRRPCLGGKQDWA